MLDPTMVRLRTAAAAVGEDIWITVRLPGRYEGDDLDDDLDDDAAITHWTTVVAHPDELGWLRQALALATDTDVGDEDDDKTTERLPMINVECGPIAPSGLALAVRPCDTISYGRDDPPAPAHSVLPIVEAD